MSKACGASFAFSTEWAIGILYLLVWRLVDIKNISLENWTLKDINKNRKQTIIVVTHSKDLAQISDKKLYLKKGVLETEE